MFCKYCGEKLMDDAVFCHACGKATNEPVACAEQSAPQVQILYTTPVQPVYQPPVQPVYQQQTPPVQPVYQQQTPPVQPVYQQPVQAVPPQYTYTIPGQPVQAAPQPIQAEKLEKLQKQTLLLGILGISLSVLGLPGFILSVIAAAKANSYKKLTGKVDGKVLTGYRLSKAGRAVGIVMTFVFILLIEALENGVHFDFDSILPDGYSEF